MSKKVGHLCWPCIMSSTELDTLTTSTICVTALKVVWRQPFMVVKSGLRKTVRGGQSSIAPCCGSSVSLTMQSHC